MKTILIMMVMVMVMRMLVLELVFLLMLYISDFIQTFAGEFKFLIRIDRFSERDSSLGHLFSFLLLLFFYLLLILFHSLFLGSLSFGIENVFLPLFEHLEVLQFELSVLELLIRYLHTYDTLKNDIELVPLFAMINDILHSFEALKLHGGRQVHHVSVGDLGPLLEKLHILKEVHQLRQLVFRLPALRHFQGFFNAPYAASILVVRCVILLDHLLRICVRGLDISIQIISSLQHFIGDFVDIFRR